MKRSGTTLVEVLVAMFIMTIGMLALLVLFPAGLLRMAVALRDDRAAQAMNQAKAVANLLDVRHDSKLNPGVKDYFTNPGSASIDASDGYPSYAVFVDPIGLSISPQTHVGSGGSTNMIRRVSHSRVNSLIDRRNWFSLNDELQFDNQGAPLASSGVVQRNASFSWAYLLQRPNQGEPRVVECSTVLFFERPELLVDLTLPEGYFDKVTPNNINPTNPRNTFTIPANSLGILPKLKIGDWILDATVEKKTVGANTVVIPHARFYRVTSISETATDVEVGVHLPIQNFSAGSLAEIIVIEGVYDVIEHGPGRLP